jgi:hypothetical protein
VEVYFKLKQTITNLHQLVTEYKVYDGDTYRLCGSCAVELYGDIYNHCAVEDCGKSSAEVAIYHDVRRNTGSLDYDFMNVCPSCEEQYYAEIDAIDLKKSHY